MENVELRPAGEWTCDDCGRNNFCSYIRPDHLSDEDKREIAESMGVEWSDGEFLMAPEVVQCSFCESEFRVEDEIL